MTDYSVWPGRTVTKQEANYGDIENFIQHHYGRRVSIPAYFEKGNDSYVQIEITPTPWEEAPDDDDYGDGSSRDLMRQWLEAPSFEEQTAAGTPYYMVQFPNVNPEVVLSDACSKGLVSAGEVYVEIWW